MKVRVDPDLCTGHGRCYVLAPDVFGEDERGHCRIACDRVSPDVAVQAWAGLRNCPEGAISIDLEDGES